MNRTNLRFALMAIAAAMCNGALAAPAPSDTSQDAGGWQSLNAAPGPAVSLVSSQSPALTSVAPAASSASTNTAVASVEVASPISAVVSSAAKSWSVSTSDTNFRQLLDHWTQQEGWKLVWNYGEDVPIVGDDTITGDFKFATRRALASTELTDTPIKPCFYSNHTLRVVSLTTQCDPTRSAAAQ